MKLGAEAIATKLTALKGWTLEDGALQRQFTFASFPDAIAYVTRLAFDAQEADHHPDLLISYRKVTVRWSTHSAGGITEKDFVGVAQADAVAKNMSA